MIINKIGYNENLKNELTEQDNLISQIQAALEGKTNLELPPLTNPTTTDKVLDSYEYINTDGTKSVGTMANNGAVSKTLNAGGSYNIPAGYHNGSGKVTANSLASQTEGDATATQILSGKIAWVDGAKVTGTMTNKSGTTTSATPSLDTTNSRVRLRVPTSGYYNTSAYLYSSYSSIADKIGLTADKIIKGNTILGITGTAETVSDDPINSSNWIARGTTNVSSSGNGVKITCTTLSEYSGATYSIPIDVSELDVISVTISDASSSNIGSGWHSLVAVVSKIQTTSDALVLTTTANTTTVTGAGTYNIDVSTLSGNYYVYVQSSYTTDRYLVVSGIRTTKSDKYWLVKDGKYVNLAGKWSSNSTQGDGYIQQTFASGSTAYYACYDPIDLTNYNTLTVIVSKAYTGSTARTRQLWVSAYDSITEPTNKASKTGINAADTYTIDISSLTGYHMVRWRGQYDALQWTDMYLS